MKKLVRPHSISNRIVSAVVMLALTLSYGLFTLDAQTSGLPAPSLPPLTSGQATTLFGALTGCTTGGYNFQPATGTCAAGSQTYPSVGIMVSTGSGFGTSLTAPASTIVGISDTQTLTNKSIAYSQITGFTFPASGIGVGTTDTQTLTNKSIAYTEITGFTFPASGIGVGTTDTQTLTNKSINGSEINSGSLLPSVQASSETVSFSATPTFSATTQYSTITLTANVTTFTLAAGTAGQNKTLTFCQNATGGYTVVAPTNVHGFMSVGTTLSKCSSQPYTYDSTQTAWLASGPGVVNE
jgi:hypothetical protein